VRQINIELLIVVHHLDIPEIFEVIRTDPIRHQHVVQLFGLFVVFGEK
jgi:hypothetical protein